MLQLRDRRERARRLAAALAAAVRRSALLVLAAALTASGVSAAVIFSVPAADGALSAAPQRAAYDPQTGTTVTVTEPTDATPVHPEALTHPQRDGSISASVPGQATLLASASPGGLRGIDVASYQGDVNWSSVAPSISFVYAKATEGTSYRNPYFANQYEGPYNAGRMHGAYHMAIPSNSGGATQASYFVSHGGGWSPDGRTLPGALDIEPNPYGSNECYGLSQASMRSWISSFVSQYAFDTGVYPVIYTTNNWWRACTGNTTAFTGLDPLWLASYASQPGPLPGGYGFYTFWQFQAAGSLPGDQDVFNGSAARLQALVRG